MKEFQICKGVDYSLGFTAASTSTAWNAHVIALGPTTLHIDVRNRLTSNLSHIMSSLDIQAGLIMPHAERNEREGGREILFEPFYNTLIQNFCTGTYSVCEGLGAAYVLHKREHDGTGKFKISRDEWAVELAARINPDDQRSVQTDIETVCSKRDLIHQDKLSLRDDIDWHAIDYEGAFLPARRLIAAIVALSGEDPPLDTNLAP